MDARVGCKMPCLVITTQRYKSKITRVHLYVLSSAGEVRGVVQDLWRTDDIPDVQKLPESPDQLRHPGGRCPRSHWAARDRIQRPEAETLLCPSECELRGLGKGSQGAWDTARKSTACLQRQLRPCASFCPTCSHRTRTRTPGKTVTLP